MELGAFSISLDVQDIAASRDFYATLGFSEIGGNIDQNWLILQNGGTVIGLFKGMIEKNSLTFNPGWAKAHEPMASFDDVRQIQAALLAAGVPLKRQADPDGEGPDYITLTDPDGNPILIDQHTDKPAG